MPDQKTSRTGLSKSLYLRGMQCHKSLYLLKHHKKLQDKKKDSQQAVFAAGTAVGKLAQDLFPGGEEISVEDLTIPERVKKTRELIDAGITTIYEASFEYDGLFVMVDILHKGENGWDLYEVKSSTSVKDVNLHDVSFQYYVLTNAGIDVHKAYLVHIDTSYIRNGDIEVDKLFTIVDLTDSALSLLTSVPLNIKSIRSALSGETPNIDIGPHCSDPYECDFHGYCWRHIPNDSIFSLRGRGINKFDFYKKGIIKFEDLPLGELNDVQLFQAEMHLKRGEQIEPEGLIDFLSSLWYPLCHFDFETFTSPVPLYDGTSPYQQIPFQYSLHIQHEKGGPVEHREFLAEPNEDPRENLINKMIAHIPIGACVLTYHMAFEKTRIQELIKAFPKYADRLNLILENVRDLIVPFRKRYAYRWQQKGSNSIKDVLPAFTDLSYKDLEISDGGMAMDAYHIMCKEKDHDKYAKLRKNLKLYCERDTEAMVKLHQCLEDIVAGKFISGHL